MSIQSISSGMGGADWLPGPRTQVGRPEGDGSPPRAGDVSPGASPPVEDAPAEGAISARPPEGTDAALWSVLTSEERTFFVRARTGGPLTYGPGRSASAAGLEGLRGNRVDVRV